MELEPYLPVERLLAKGPAFAAEALPAPGTPRTGRPDWDQTIELPPTDWWNWPHTTSVALHLDRAGRVDGYRLTVPYDREAHPDFRGRVLALLTERWGRPTTRGKQLVFTGKAGRATARDIGGAWELELLVRLPRAGRVSGRPAP